MASPSPSDILTLDGRTLEGGGQLLRLALSLSALTSIPLRIHSIRGARSGGGGLKAQHLACVNWLAHACNAQVQGAEKGSKEITFVPGENVGEASPAFKKQWVGDGNAKREVYEAKLDIKTAGSTGLGLQAILPFILFTRFLSPLPVRLTLSGGTNVSQSPSYEYITQVLLPTLERIGFPRIEAKLGRRGWSHGGASIGNFVLEIPPRPDVVLPAFHLTPPKAASPADGTEGGRTPHIQHLRATLIAPETCHAHFSKSLQQSLKQHFPQPTFPSFTETHGTLTLTLEDSKHPKRMYFILVATINHAPTPPNTGDSSKEFTLGRDWLYDRKLPQKASGSSHDGPAEELADRVCADLEAELASGACVDEHMRDQLVIFQALADGRSEIYGGGEGREASLHARTAEWVAETVLGARVEFDGRGGCVGFGFGGEGRKGGGERVVGLEEGMARLDVG